MMDPKRYRQIRQIFDDVMALDAAERPGFLANQADPSVRADVERLIAASDRATGVFAEAAATAVVAVETSERWEGRRLGPYEILHELGEGGMGVVYLARRADGAFEKQVAIKVVRQSLATREFLARFQREREILARLEHPNIARLLDGGSTPNGLAYLVMEYVKGEPLLAYADSRRLSYNERLRLLRQIAEAVDYAHTQGVVHRDLKPSNILVSVDGQVKLLDFGIASWQEPAVSMEASAPTIALSPAYASPEQARGERTTGASDVYSFAMVAYEVLTGVLPFPVTGTSLEQVLEAIRELPPKSPADAVVDSSDPAAIAHLRDTSPARLVYRLRKTAEAPLLKALSKRREDRPATAAELMQSLEAPVPVEHTIWRRAGQFVGPFVPALLAAGMIAFLVLTGEVIIKPFGWALLLCVCVALTLRETPSMKSWAANPVILFLVLLFAARIVWSFVYGVDSELRAWEFASAGLASAILGLFLYYSVAFFRRSRTLGPLQTALRPSPNRLQLMLFGIMCVSHALDYRAKGRVFDLAFACVLLLAIIAMILPFEIRKNGICSKGQTIQWTEIEGYAWLGGGDFVFHVQRSVFPGFRKEKVSVNGGDQDRVRTELQKWLIETSVPEIETQMFGRAVDR